MLCLPPFDLRPPTSAARRDRLLVLIALLPLSAAVAAPKTDVVVFQNGDRLTGEVKGLDRGRLSFDTDATGTIAIEWARVKSVDTAGEERGDLQGSPGRCRGVRLHGPGRLSAEHGRNGRAFPEARRRQAAHWPRVDARARRGTGAHPEARRGSGEAALRVARPRPVRGLASRGRGGAEEPAKVTKHTKGSGRAW